MRVPARSYGRVALSMLSRGPRSSGVPIPAPSGGWDADSPLSAMKADRAIQIDNWFPSADGIELRRGFWQHAVTGQAGPVESLMAYHSAIVAGDRLFAASGDKIFDVTSRGVAPVAVQTGLGGARWQSVAFANDGGQFLWMCNGADAPRIYNGAAWSTANITGVNAPDIINVTSHKRRLWLVLKNSLNAAYLPIDSAQGAASVFPLAGQFTKGGYLVAVASWATDGGEGGLDDLLCFISSRGQVAVYQGSNPDDANDFGFVGVWDYSPPIGRRCVLRVANDLALVTQDGIVPISAGAQVDRSSVQNKALTKRIRNAMSQAARRYGRNFGWQLLAHPTGNMAILNVPLAEGISAHQYVMNTLNGGWCRFTGQAASCWANFNDGIYFGGPAGTVYQADVSDADYGRDIVADLRGAFNDCRRPGTQKLFNMIKTTITTDGDFAPALGLDTDFGSTPLTDSAGGSAASDTAVWDAFDWDAASWAEDMASRSDWSGVSGMGEMASVRLRLVVKGKTGAEFGPPPLVRVNGFTLSYEGGGVL